VLRLAGPGVFSGGEIMTDRTGWSKLLTDFTQRHAGRRARLEVDDPDLGAQWLDSDHPLLGVAYDRRDDRIEIMLGEMGDVENRLTHTIPGATVVELAASNGGETLRIGHGESQTLLHVG
jgi:hypothetical protein